MPLTHLPQQITAVAELVAFYKASSKFAWCLSLLWNKKLLAVATGRASAYQLRIIIVQVVCYFSCNS